MKADVDGPVPFARPGDGGIGTVFELIHRPMCKPEYTTVTTENQL